MYVLGDGIDHALREITSASLRNAVGENVLDDVLSNRAKIVGEAKRLVENGLPAGISVDRIFMEDIIIPR